MKKLLLALLLSTSVAHAADGDRVAGNHSGIWYWKLPNMATGTTPKQSWSGAGEGPNGEVYVAGMDHISNSGLYKLGSTGGNASQPGNTLAYVGSGRVASASSLGYGDLLEKYHTQPTMLGTKVYVANMNYSNIDAQAAGIRGFRWYVWDNSASTFSDLTNAVVQNFSLVALAADASRNRIYGLGTPTGQLVRLDTTTGTTTLIGKPSWSRDYVYPGRGMWLGSTGRVYFSAGNPGTGDHAGGPYPEADFNHVYWWDPTTEAFGEQTGWTLTNTRAIDFATCVKNSNPRTCYGMDNIGDVYRYRESSGKPSFAKIGSIGQTSESTYGLVWVFQVNPAGTKAYILARRGDLFEMNLSSGGTATRIGNLYTLEPWLNGQDFYGSSTWDANGRMYFAAFPKIPTEPGRAKLVAINPTTYITAIR